MAGSLTLSRSCATAASQNAGLDQTVSEREKKENNMILGSEK